jgi:cell division protein FtsB
MTRKFLLVFTLSLVLSFPLMLSVFGEGGFLHNQALRREIERLKYSQQVLSLQVDSLKNQQDRMGERDAIQDAAFKYGYQSEGEQVFYFNLEEDDASLQVPVTASAQPALPAFAGLSIPLILFMALAFSTLLAVCYTLLVRKRRKNRGLDG